MQQTIAAACCLAIIAVAGFADKPLKEKAPAPQTLTTLETNVVTPAKIDKCDNPDCACEDCQCDPCECPCDAKAVEAVDDRPIIYFFTAKDCVYCPPMKRLADQLKAEGHRVWPVDVDDEANSRYVDYYKVTRVPQFVTVTPQGAEIRRTAPGTTTRERVLGLEPTTQTMFPTPGTWSQPAYSESSYRVQPPQRTGWFRGRMTRSVCGPGGCR